jgi:MFS family permease
MWYLAIVVVATVVLYYELYIGGAVSPKILVGYGMTFPFYVYISVVGNAIGAFGSLLAGLGDRWGRANLTAYGLVITALLALFGIPNAGDKWTFAILSVIIGLVEGVILVATPALVRDFSPQLGRASAMGFWTLGPVIGSLVVAVVSTNTVNHLGAWQDQYIICGIVGLVVGVVALFGLRELSPQLRDQLMVSLHDRALIEAKARGINVEDAMGRSHWRQMIRPDIVGSAFAISVFLLIYYAAVGFFTIYFTSLFGYSLSKANSIGNWFWAFDAGVLIITGIVSDRFRVRKPFMVIGGIGAIVMTIVFLNLGPSSSYGTIVTVISILAAFLAIAYAPWMASFTETVEKHNPALIATGLAVWGWIIRIVVALSALIVPIVVGSITPLVTYGSTVSTYAVQYASQLATAQAITPAHQAALQANPSSTAALTAAVTDIATTLKVTPAVATQKLTALGAFEATPTGKQVLVFMSEHAAQVQTSAAAAPGQWKNWWWVCVGGEVLFLPFIFLMTGRWSPRKAKEDADAHEAAVQAELAALGQDA